MKRIKMIGVFFVLIYSISFSDMLNSKGLVNAYEGTTNQQYVCNKMDEMARVQWKPLKDVTIYSKKYYAKTTYKGIPYSQNHNYSIEDFIAVSRFSNGIYIYRANGGNDCSSSVALAWRTCFSRIPYDSINTETFLDVAVGKKANKIATRGAYDLDDSITNTKSFCNNNPNKVKSYYSKMKVGDCCFYRVGRTNGSGHAILIVSNNASAQRATVIEQCGLGQPETALNSSWRYKKTYTYDELKNKGYLPIYCTCV